MKIVNPSSETELQTESPVIEKIEAEVGDNYFLVKKEDLITKGKLYNRNAKIFARTLNVPEVKRLANILMNPENAEFIVNDTLKKCVKGIEIDDLYVEDKMYLLFLLRANTFKDSNYSVEYFCEKCETDATFHFTIDNLRAKFLPDDYNPTTLFELKNGDKITLSYLRVSDQKEIDNLRDTSIAKKSEKLDTENLSIAASIGTINGKRHNLITKYDYVNNNISPEDFSDLKTYMEDKDIGIQPVMDVVCKECGGSGAIPVSFHSRFFLPKRKF